MAEGDGGAASAGAEGSNAAAPLTFVCSSSRGESCSPTNGDVMNRYSGEVWLLKT